MMISDGDGGQGMRHVDALESAVVLVDPELADSVLGALEKTTGRAVARYIETTSRGRDDHVAADAPVVYVGPSLPESLRLEKLVWFHSTNAGVDTLLRSGPWPARAMLTRTVGRMGDRIAQYVLAWILAECQTVPVFLAQHQRAEWRRVPSELAAGQTALIYGTGHIGARVGALLRGCNIHTVGVARTARVDVPGFDETVATDTADALLGQVRWVVSTLPLTPETEGFFDAARFTAMRGATFINTGRGATVDLPALAASLDRGAVRAAVLDVLREEPPGSDDAVWRLPRTVITSHSAGITAPEDVCTDFAACWEALSEGRTPELAVTPTRGY
jgi:phosphoglycerate dehydrogenase-like enzyme